MAKSILTDKIVSDLKPRPGKKNPDKLAAYEVPDSLCKGLFVRVEPSGTKTWWIYLYSPDNAKIRKRYRHRIGGFPTFRLYTNTPSKKADRDRSIRDVAEELKARARTVDLAAERKAAIANADKDKTATLRGFIDLKYLDHYRSEGYTRPEAQMKWLKSAFCDLMDMRLESITHLTLRKWQKEAAQTRAPATIARLLQSLSGVLSYAVSEGDLPHHPLQAKQRKKSTTSLKLPKVNNKRVRFLDEVEEKRLLKTLSERDRRMITARLSNIQHKQERGYKEPPAIEGVYADHLHPMILIAMNTGIRFGALVQLEWRDITNNQIHVRASLDKAKVGYYVPLNEEAAEVLGLWKHQTGDRGLIFQYQGNPIKSVKTAWGKVLKQANITDFRFHDLRHHFASMLIKKKESLYTVSRLLGHSSLDMTARYAHIDDDDLKAAVRKLDS